MHVYVCARVCVSIIIQVGLIAFRVVFVCLQQAAAGANIIIPWYWEKQRRGGKQMEKVADKRRRDGGWINNSVHLSFCLCISWCAV